MKGPILFGVFVYFIIYGIMVGVLFSILSILNMGGVFNG